MAASICGHCNNDSFEIAEVSLGAQDKQGLVQCSACGAVVGVIDASNPAALLQEQKAEIAALRGEVRALRSALEKIVQALNRI